MLAYVFPAAARAVQAFIARRIPRSGEALLEYVFRGVIVSMAHHYTGVLLRKEPVWMAVSEHICPAVEIARLGRSFLFP